MQAKPSRTDEDYRDADAKIGVVYFAARRYNDAGEETTFVVEDGESTHQHQAD